MKTLKFIKNQLIVFYNWLNRQTEFKISFYAIIAWFFFFALHIILKTESYPIGMFQKIAFGIIGMSVIQGVSWFQLKKTNPFYADLIDPDTAGGIKNLTEWQQIKIGLFYWSFYAVGAIVLASLC